VSSLQQKLDHVAKLGAAIADLEDRKKETAATLVSRSTLSLTAAAGFDLESRAGGRMSRFMLYFLD
jgi:hypothetical protein